MSQTSFLLTRVDENIDALSYIDNEYDYEYYKEQVDDLVFEEMQNFQPRNYLELLPPMPDLFQDHPMLKQELERIEKNLEMQKMDVERYKVKPPQEDTVEEWEKSIENAKSQLEHQSLRIINLELLNQYGVNTWLLHNQVLDQTKKRLQEIKNEYQDKQEDINSIRKKKQEEAFPKLARLENEWYQLIYKNHQIENACKDLEKKIKKLQLEKGIVPEEQKNDNDNNNNNNEDNNSNNNDNEEINDEVNDEIMVNDRKNEQQQEQQEQPQQQQQQQEEEEEEKQEENEMVDEDESNTETLEMKRTRIQEYVNPLLVRELKAELKKYELSLKGKKAELAKRLFDYLMEQEENK